VRGASLQKMQADTELAQAPADGITAAVFANTNNTLLAASWDGTLRLYDAEKNELHHMFQPNSAQLDASFSVDDGKGFAGGVDSKLRMFDFKSGSSTVLGEHSKAIKCVEYCGATGLVLTGSWDRSLKLWDPRAHDPLSGSCELKGKVFSMSLSGNKAVVATSERHVLIFDTRKLSAPEQDRLSSLQHQLRVVRCFPNATGYAVGSTEGRVAIEYFDPNPEIQKKKYAFKCHRKNVDGQQLLYPVNALAFHPKYGTFASGGCDGVVSVWDGFAKKRICQYPKYETSIAYLDYNFDGSLLAITQSYTFEENERDHPRQNTNTNIASFVALIVVFRDAIFIRKVTDQECKSRVVQ